MSVFIGTCTVHTTMHVCSKCVLSSKVTNGNLKSGTDSGVRCIGKTILV